MRIKSIELIGFKSFYYKTRLEFHPRVNVFVGPNGCGKSNILDALKWVLGEQNPRRLRADSMEDLISAGNETLKPLGMAEVSLALEDGDGEGFSETVVKRRLYRSGESEYYINGVQCRLKDIRELFIDKGIGARAYSVVDQGMVERMVMLKPEERRSVVEEVAGIQKYKLRRKETESKIRSTLENLARVRDIRAEVERNLRMLAKQAERAEEFKNTSAEAKLAEAALIEYRLRALDAETAPLVEEKETLARRIEALREGSSSLHRSIEAREEELRRLRGLHADGSRRIEDLRRRLARARSALDVARAEIASLDDYVSNLGGDAASLADELRTLENLRAEKEAALAALRDELKKREEEVSRAAGSIEAERSEHERALDELETRRRALIKHVDVQGGLRAALRAAERECREVKERAERLHEELRVVEEEARRHGMRLESLRADVEALAARAAALEAERDAARRELGQLEDDIAARRREFEGVRLRLGELTSRRDALAQIESGYEWLPEGIREFVLERKGKGVLGIVADFVAPLEGYETALEGALAERLKWVVVRRWSDALEMAREVESLGLGRLTFVALEGAEDGRGGGVRREVDGAFGTPLYEVLRIDDVCARLIEDMVSSLSVVDGLDDAAEPPGGGRVCVVTRDGVRLHPRRSVSAGRLSARGIFLRRREMERLEVEIGALSGRVESLDAEIRRMEDERGSLRRRVEDAEGELRALRLAEAEAAKDISNLEETLAASRRRRHAMLEELSRLEAEAEDKHAEMEAVGEKLAESESKKAALEKEIERLERDVRRKGDVLREGEERLAALRVEAARCREKCASLEHEVEELARRRSLVEERLSGVRGEMERRRLERESKECAARRAEAEAASLENQLRLLEREQSERAEALEEAEEELGRMRGERERVLGELEDADQRFSGLTLDLEKLAIERVRLGEQKAALREALLMDEDQLARRLPLPAGDGEAERLERRLERLKRRLEGFGPVNLLAPDEYRELESRHEFLTEQIADLEHALEALRKAIRKIDAESSRRFLEGFGRLDEKFRTVFARLFDGGEAKLVLTDPDDPLETGVDIMIRPRGKKFISTASLSGGEKALSAIALIIAACLVRPAPFLLLDEIDAPLDDVNTAAFARLMEEISEISQVVTITHNKRTMQFAGSLVGVTSNGSGVSKIVSVKLEDAVRSVQESSAEAL